MPKGWSAKDERMKKHISAGYGGGKEADRIAFATVNKFRSSKKKRKK